MIMMLTNENITMNNYDLVYSLNYLCHKDSLDVNICLQVLLITCRKVFNGQLTWRDLHCCNLQDKATRGNSEIANTVVTTCTKSILQGSILNSCRSFL